MARASRSSKKQPAFDPSEITDLIFSPAVGSGVGSHLLGAPEQESAFVPTNRDTKPDMSTVANLIKTTMDISQGTEDSDPLQAVEGYPVTEDADEHLSTVDGKYKTTADTLTEHRTTGLQSAGTLLQRIPSVRNNFSNPLEHVTTVDILHQPTVDSLTVETAGQRAEQLLETRPIASETTVEKSSTPDTPTVVPSDMSTVHLAPVQAEYSRQVAVFWVTEQGDLVPHGRVKRIRLAQDVINSAEESVYDTLWTARSQTDERELYRVVQAGYDYLVKRTRLSKKTIQRIVAKLIDKDFIAIERPADIYQRSSTVYRVFSYKAVLERHVQRGRSHVAKMGPGFSYVHPMADPRHPTQPISSSAATQSSPPDLSTVAISIPTPVVNKSMSTAVNRPTETLAESDQSTVVNPTTTYIGKDDLEQKTSSSAEIYQALRHYGVVDDDLVDRLKTLCKQQAPDCTNDEIIHFIQEKGALIRVRDSRIYSPIGFLLTAVPKCFSGEAFRLYREEQNRRRLEADACERRRQAELDEWRADQESCLADPNVSEQDKQFIRECLGI